MSEVFVVDSRSCDGTPGIAREFGAILNLDELLTKIANLTKRVIDYRTFGILLLNEDTNELEMKVAVRYGDMVQLPRVKLGVGLVGFVQSISAFAGLATDSALPIPVNEPETLALLAIVAVAVLVARWKKRK